VKWFVFRHFEQILVILLVASLLAIHGFVDHKIGFLSFYYLPIIAAGFYLGRRPAIWSSVLVVALVVFFQLVVGLDRQPGIDTDALLALVPWGGFLILTANTVGSLAEQRQQRAETLRGAYVTLIELLTFHIEASERQQRGHTWRVAKLAVEIAEEMGVSENEIELLRVAALLHEIGLEDRRLSRIIGQFPGSTESGPLQGALDLLEEFEEYHENIAREWPADRIRVSVAAKILAVADAYETLLMSTPNRPAFAPWTALEEIEKGSGQSFGSDVVRALRRVGAQPTRLEEAPRLAVLA
jgi:hypothetical protein